MTDAVADTRPVRSLAPATEEAKARIRRRYRAEARFKAYGIAAIAFAALFLLVLLADILSKGLPAFFVSKVMLPVTLTVDDIDPAKTGNPAEIAKGNFAAPIRQALLAEFPEGKERAVRKLLTGLVSSGAADQLRSLAMADPKLVGTEVKVPLLLSDDADLYLKGFVTKLAEEPGTGTATPSGTEGTIDIASTSNDFARQLAYVKAELGDKLRAARRDAEALNETLEQLNSTIRALTAEIAAASGDKSVLEQRLAKAQGDRDSITASIGQLNDRLLSLKARLGAPDAAEQLDATLPSLLLKINGGVVKVTSVGKDKVTGDVMSPLASANPASAGAWQVVHVEVPEGDRRLSDREVLWLEALRAKGQVETQFNWAFFTSGDSREPELAGILGGLVGSLLTLFVTLAICLPVGVAAAIYLEEFAPKNRFTSLIEVNINNLAAVPSIVFGLLGLAVFLNFFGMPRSSALVGGLVLALLVLPTIIIASRAALKAVPPSIREGALGVGASHQQAVFHHVLPLAMPGILTGTIIGMAHALGETAPLLMIGMVAFIVDVPQSFTEAATALPVQIFLWSDLPEVAFKAKTSAAIIVLLLFLFVMNGAAIYLRRRFERRW